MHTYRLSIAEDLNQIPASTTAFTTTAAMAGYRLCAPGEKPYEIRELFVDRYAFFIQRLFE
jgi:hypothetical protein